MSQKSVFGLRAARNWKRIQKFVSGGASLALISGMLMAVGAPPANALEPAVLEITKKVKIGSVTEDLPNAPTVSVGEQFDWVINIVCHQQENDCVNAVLTDTIPDEFEIIEDSINSAPAGNITVAGQNVTIAFQEPLTSPSGEVGLVGGANVTIPVKLRGIPQSRDGEVFTNAAAVEADNAPKVTDDAAVTASVSLLLQAEAGKSFDPETALVEPGAPVALTFGGKNTSNGSVSSLTVQDPQDPASSPNIFQQYLEVNSLTSATWPQGAEKAVVSVWDMSTSEWLDALEVSAPGPLALPEFGNTQDIGGVRIEFSATNPTIPTNAATSVQLALSQRASVTGITVDTQLNNVATAKVAADSASSAVGTASAAIALRPANSLVAATKDISPTEIAVTGSSTQATVTLGAENAGTRTLEALTINEPTNPADLSATNILAPAFTGGGVSFSGFGTIQWPYGATDVSIKYYFEDGSSATVSSTASGSMPEPISKKRVTGFSVMFSGEIIDGAEALVPFTVDAPAGLNGQLKVTGINTIQVTGTSPGTLPDPAPATASDDLTVYDQQITITTEKSLTNDWLWSIPGQTTTAKLKTTIADYPKTTQNVNQVIIDDPSVKNGVTDWYEHFDATGITLTQIPTNATLTVQWRDAAGEFYDVPGMVDLPGGVFSGQISLANGKTLEDVVGIRFIYNSDSGFVPGQSLVPNISYTSRGTIRTTGEVILSNHDPRYADDLEDPLYTVENCSASEASADDLRSDRVEVEPPCPEINLMPVGEGVGPGLDKSWSPDTVFSRSGQRTTATLNWNAGIQGLDKIVVSDVAADPMTGNPSQQGADSVFDTFNLTRIGAIADPLFEFDRVHVQVFNSGKGAWEDVSACTETLQCSGSLIPAITLTASQQHTTTAVRFIVTEKPGRAPTVITDPLAGTGVAVGSRNIPLTLELRDTRRSNGDPVVDGPLYNTMEPGRVLNSSSLGAYVDEVRTYWDTSNDTVELVDPELAIKTTKTVTGSPVAIPTAWQTPAPTVRYDVATTNTTAGIVSERSVGGRVSELRIVEPGNTVPGNLKSPFETFDLVRFHNLTVPAGTAKVTVQFTGSGAPADVVKNSLNPTPLQAQVLTALQDIPVDTLRNVTGYTVSFTGNIASGDANGTARVWFDMELRQVERSNSAIPVTVATHNPVGNTVMGSVSDPRWDGSDFVDRTLSANAEAPVALQGGSLSVVAGKKFSPTSQIEPSIDDLMMTLSGRPAGTERTKVMELTDDRATFWNAYNFTRVSTALNLPTFAPDTAANRLQIQFSVCTDRDFTTWGTAVTADPLLADAGCVATGGAWAAYTAPMSATDARSWMPTNPDDVQGVKMRITRGAEMQWENPVSPTINVPVMVERRATLRSGGDVPSTLNDGNPAAPGEAAKGVTTNTVRADVTGAWGGTASSSADQTLKYGHASNSVVVQKTPIGVRSPGSTFDYTLTVRNNGAREIVDPVITDNLPRSAALGTLVQFDPDADSATPKYKFATSGPASATMPMPTVLGGANGVTVVEDLGSTSPMMQFTFPTGTRLAVGQTYTITFKMMFVPGVVEGQPVVNAFNVTGDRVWDACTAPSGHTASLSADGTECATEAMVTPQRLPAIRGVKSVRAVNAEGNGYNEHGFANDTACVNRVDASDFASQPCIPRTVPGQAEEWRLSITNNGTTPLNRIVVADLLPTPGDQTIIAGFVRNSQWTPTLTSKNPTVPGASGTLASYVTTAPANATCVSTTVRNPVDAGLASCIDTDGGDSAAKTKFVPFASMKDHSQVTALLFVFDPLANQQIAPGAKIAVQFETRTGAYSVQDAQDPQAFNSLTVSALYPQTSAPDAPLSVLSARDQSRSGVALITGSVKIEKQVSGAGAGFVPTGQVFSGALECTSLGLPIPTQNFTVTVGTPTVIDNLPAGASCRATETSASGQTSYTSTTVTVPQGDDIQSMPTIQINNIYELTKLVVSKGVASSATNIPSGFGFEVECAFLGKELVLDPADASFTLDHGEERTIAGLPVNASCTVTEVDDRDADSVNVEAESLDAADEAWGAVTENNPGSNATIDGLAPATGSNRADFTNTYGASAAIRVEKNLVGGAADLAADLTFTVHVVCVFEGEALLDQNVELNAGNGWGKTLSSLVAGAECTITEPSRNGADAVVVTPNDGADTSTGVVTVPADATGPVLVDVTNRFLAGSIEVTKAVTGDGASLYGTGDFVVELVCTLNSEPVRVLGGADRTLNAENLLASYTGIPSGAECQLTETSNSGATESRIRLGASGTWSDAADPGVSFTVDIDGTIASNSDQVLTPVELENRFDLAEVSVMKNVVSEAVDQEGTPIEYGPFEIELVCTFNGDPVEVPGGAVKTLLAGETVTWDRLPAGALCEATETDAADAVNVWFEQPAENPEDKPVRTEGEAFEFAPLAPLGSDALNEVNLFNAFDSTRLTIQKSVVGSGAHLGTDKSFEVDLLCTLTDASRPEGEEVWNDRYTLSAVNKWRVEVDGVASNAECSIVETSRGGANATQIKLGNSVIGTDNAEFSADEPTLTVTVVNTFHALSNTGTNGIAAIAILGSVLMLGGALVSAVQGRKRQRARHA